MPSDDLFVSEQHPVSRRWAVVEDDGRVGWLYLTEPDGRKPVADCWLYNRVRAPSVCCPVRGQAPLAPTTHVSDTDAAAPPDEGDVWFRWSSDGESVSVHFETDLVGFIAAKRRHGLSRNLSKEGPFGSPLDRKLYAELFGSR